MSKKILIPMAAFALVGLGFTGVNIVMAHGFGIRDNSMVKSLSSKLNVSEDKVQTAFDTIRSERQAEMEKQYEDMLTQAVKDGKITDIQKLLILTKHKELQTRRDAEMQAKQKEQEDLKTWADQNGIDTSYLSGGFGMHKGMGRGMMRDFDK